MLLLARHEPIVTPKIPIILFREVSLKILNYSICDKQPLEIENPASCQETLALVVNLKGNRLGSKVPHTADLRFPRGGG